MVDPSYNENIRLIFEEGEKGEKNKKKKGNHRIYGNRQLISE